MTPRSPTITTGRSMEDPLHVGDRSVLEYGAMKLRDIPDKVFTKDYLKKLE